MPMLECGDTTLAYEETGQGPALVFIHGAFTDRRLWRLQIAHFAARCRCVTYDLRGHGATGPSPRRRYDVDLFAEDLERLLDGLNVDRARLVGASLGGMIAQRFAERHPQRVEALFLLSSFADTTGPQPDLPPLHLVPNWMATLALSLWGMRRFVAYARRRAAELQGHPVSFGEEEAPMVSMKPSEVAKVYKAVFTFRAAPPPWRLPVTVACGALEHPAVKAHSAALAKLHGVPLVVIPDAGHVAGLEQAQAFNRLLERFLQEAPGPSYVAKRKCITSPSLTT